MVRWSLSKCGCGGVYRLSFDVIIVSAEGGSYAGSLRLSVCLWTRKLKKIDILRNRWLDTGGDSATPFSMTV